MSCLLLKSTSGNLPTESIHEGLGETSLRQCFEGGPCRSTSDQLSLLAYGYSNGRSRLEKLTLRSADPQQGIWSAEEEEPQKVGHPENDCQKVWEKIESCNIPGKPPCLREDQVEWGGYIVDDLVSKLVSHLHLQSKSLDSSIPKVDFQESDYQGVDAQDAKPSASSLNVGISNISTNLGVKDCNILLPVEVPEPVVSAGNRDHGPVELKSALRGGHEKSGLGSRPQMNVSWAPDVYDPPCTSTSHKISQNHRRHHHPKSQRRGKGNSRSDSQKKCQRKFRRLRHADEYLISGSNMFPGTGQQSCLLSMKDDMALLLNDVMPKGSRVGSCVSLQKPCFLSPMLSLDESELLMLDTIQSCNPRHVTAHKLLL